MCCAKSSGAQRSPGSSPSTCASAGGPPVEATIPITSTAPACASDAGSGRAANRCRRTTGTSAIRRIDSASLRPQARMSPEAGFAINSSAPAAIALNDSSCSRCSLTELITSTRAGESAMIAAVAPSPSRRGILTSMVITSGRSARAIETASTPSRASPTTEICGSSASSAESALRSVAESSATSTRITRAPFAARSPRSLPRAAGRRRSPSW